MRRVYLIYALFFASGISGLMYEVVWLRMLARVTGVTMHATATVLAAFMTGLALGSFLFGRFIDRRNDFLRVYAILELLVGCSALVVPLLFSYSVGLYQYVHMLTGEDPAVTTAVRAVVSFLSLLVPTTIMGGTLPILTSGLVKSDRKFGASFSLLYGLNTLGAVFGVLLSGFVTIGELGEVETVYIGAAINLAVATAAYLVFRTSNAPSRGRTVEPSVTTIQSSVISPYSDKVRGIVLVVFTVSGLTALAYEVIWTRQLILFLLTSIYTFSGMLVIYLSGIALGSITMRWFVDRLRAPLALFGFLELGIGLISVVNLHLFAPLDGAFHMTRLGPIGPAVAAAILVFPLTFMLGMMFPVAGLCFAAKVDTTGYSVGCLYGCNTLGSIIGSLLAGFVMIPLLGSTPTVILLACVNTALGLLLLALEPGRPRIGRLVAIPIVLVFTILTLGAARTDPFLGTIEKRIYGTDDGNGSAKTKGKSGTEIFLNTEGTHGTVTSFSKEGNKRLWINGIGMTELGTETKLMAHLPLMFAKNPKELLVICFGMGTTIKSALVYPDLQVTVVELVPETFKTFEFYHPNDKHLLSKKNLRLTANDGRNFLLLSRKKYDVITVDPAPPIWSAGTVNLYTREFFQLCRSRLNPHGVMCLWFPGSTKDATLCVMRTFKEVFPHASVWSGPHWWGYYLIGTLDEVPKSLFFSNVDKAFSNTAMIRDVTEYDDSCKTPEQLLALQLWDKDQLARDNMKGVIMTDNHPFTEFFLWRKLLRPQPHWRPQEEMGK